MLKVDAGSISERVVLLVAKRPHVDHHLDRIHRGRGKGSRIDVSFGGVVGPGGSDNCSNQHAKRKRQHLTHLIAPFFWDDTAGDVLW